MAWLWCVFVCVFFFHFDFNFIRYWMYGKVKICIWSFFAYIVYFLNYDKILIFSCILSITVIFYYIFSLIYHFVTCQCVKICACACVWSYSIRIWKNILNQNLNIQKKISFSHRKKVDNQTESLHREPKWNSTKISESDFRVGGFPDIVQ